MFYKDAEWKFIEQGSFDARAFTLLYFSKNPGEKAELILDLSFAVLPKQDEVKKRKLDGLPIYVGVPAGVVILVLVAVVLFWKYCRKYK